MEDKQQEELLMLYGAKFAVSQMREKSNSYGRKNADGKWETVKWDAICRYLDNKIDEFKMNWKL